MIAKVYFNNDCFVFVTKKQELITFDDFTGDFSKPTPKQNLIHSLQTGGP